MIIALMFLRNGGSYSSENILKSFDDFFYIYEQIVLVNEEV